MSVNKVILLGYVGKDPDIRHPQQDTTVASFSMATNERHGAVETTEWHSLVAFGQQASVIERYVRKGTHLYIEGYLRTREYVDRYQISRRVTETVVTTLEILGRADSK